MANKLVESTLKINGNPNMSELCDEMKSLFSSSIAETVIEYFFNDYGCLPNIFDCGDIETLQIIASVITSRLSGENIRYGVRCYSTMCGTEFYIIEDSKEDAEKAFKMFLDYLFEGDEKWVDYTLNSNKVFNSDDSTIDYMVGTLDNGNNVIIVDNYYDGLKAFEFELVKNYVERF